MIRWAWADSVSCGRVELWEKETTSPDRHTWFARSAPAKIKTQTPTRAFGCRPTRFAIRLKKAYPSTEARPTRPLSLVRKMRWLKRLPRPCSRERRAGREDGLGRIRTGDLHHVRVTS